MRTIDIRQAATQLPRLVEEAARGGGFVIARAGTPLVKVVPVEAAAGGLAPRLGFIAGEIAVPGDFDRMDVARLFEG